MYDDRISCSGGGVTLLPIYFNIDTIILRWRMFIVVCCYDTSLQILYSPLKIDFLQYLPIALHTARFVKYRLYYRNQREKLV